MSRRTASRLTIWAVVGLLAPVVSEAGPLASGAPTVTHGSMSATEIEQFVHRLEVASEWERRGVIEEFSALLGKGENALALRVLQLLRGTPIERRIAITAIQQAVGAYSVDWFRDDFTRTAVSDALVQALDDEEYVRRAAGQVLSFSLFDEEVPRVFHQLKLRFEKEGQQGIDPTERGDLLRIMATKCSTCRPEAYQVLVAALGDPSPEMRAIAVRLLGSAAFDRLGGLDTILGHLAKETAPTVRAAAIESLIPRGTFTRRGYSETLLQGVVAFLRSCLAPAGAPEVQRAAATGLGALAAQGNSVPSQAIPEISALLRSTMSPEVKASCADAIGQMHAQVEALIAQGGVVHEQGVAAVEELIHSLGAPNQEVQAAAATALGSLGQKIGPKTQDMVKRLRQLLDAKESSPKLKQAAAAALGSFGNASLAALPELRAALTGQDTDLVWSAAQSIGQIGPAAAAAEGDLMSAINKSSFQNGPVAAALDQIGARLTASAEAMAQHLDDPDLRWALAKMCKRNPKVIDVLASKLEDKKLQQAAVAALHDAAIDLREAIEAGGLSTGLMTQALVGLRHATSAIAAQPAQLPDAGRTLNVLRATIDVISGRLHRWDWIWDLLKDHWFQLATVLALYMLALLAVFWRAPLWLLSIDATLSPVKVKFSKLGIELALAPVALLGLRYHRRVLDAWVADHIAAARANFAARRTVDERKEHIDLPVVLDGNQVPALEPPLLRPVFEQQQVRLLIWGEGGAGKTSLVCRLAAWAMSEDDGKRLAVHLMIPVLVEEDLVVPADAKDGELPAFLDVVRGQLQSVTGKSEPVREAVFERLLRERRVLVIVDHLSEMNDTMRKAVRPESPTFPINALAVTARTETAVGKTAARTIKPTRIQGGRTAAFLVAYLTLRNKDELFPTDEGLFAACQNLSHMVGKRTLTVLLAKMYAESLIKQKEGTGADVLPETIPDLMLSFVTELNRSLSAGRIDERRLHRAACAISWECLKPTWRPGPASRDSVLAALGADGEACLDYMENRLRIIETMGAGLDQVRVTLDPLAEYLAALYYVEHDRLNDIARKAFDKRLHELKDPNDVEGFLLAVKDSYLARVAGAKASDPLPAKIDRLLPAEDAKAA